MARDFRKEYEKVGGPLAVGEWYRSKWWGDDHLLGRTPEHIQDELSWCGRALGEMREWLDESEGGLWYSERKSGKCSYCARRDKEYGAQ